LSCPRSRQLSRHVPEDSGQLFDKLAALVDVIKGHSAVHISYRHASLSFTTRSVQFVSCDAGRAVNGSILRRSPSPSAVLDCAQRKVVNLRLSA
jgi:hypothetical protein